MAEYYMLANQKIVLKHFVHPQLRNDFIDRLRYCFKEIEHIEFVSDQHILISYESGSDKKDYTDEISAIAQSLSKIDIDFRLKKLFSNRGDYIPGDYTTHVVHKGWLREISSGLYSFSGFLARARNYLDRQFQKIARDAGAKYIDLPSVIPRDDLRNAGHFDSFPHHIYTVSNVDVTTSRCAEVRTTDSALCLVPSVCYTYYQTLRDKDFTTLQESLVTAKCRCYRYELTDVRPFCKQREFEMREIIFIGEPKSVAEMRMALIENIWDFAKSHDLKAHVVNAFDPFFIDNLATRAAFQFNREMKFELQVDCGSNKPIAVSSFNLHSTTFCKAFNIRINGKLATSGCIGFGIDRWLMALLSRYGIEKKQWPKTYHHLF